MALAQEKFELAVKLGDVGRGDITKIFHLRATTYAAATTAVGEILSDLAGVTDLTILGYRLTEVFSDAAAAYPTLLNAEANNIARCSIQLASSPTKKETLDVPGPKDTIFAGVAGTKAYNIVDITDTFIGNWVDNFKASGTCYISDGEDAAANDPLISGVRVHSRSSVARPG